MASPGRSQRFRVDEEPIPGYEGSLQWIQAASCQRDVAAVITLWGGGNGFILSCSIFASWGAGKGTSLHGRCMEKCIILERFSRSEAHASEHHASWHRESSRQLLK